MALGVLALLAQLLTQLTHVHVWQVLLEWCPGCILTVDTLLNTHTKPIVNVLHTTIVFLKTKNVKNVN